MCSYSGIRSWEKNIRKSGKTVIKIWAIRSDLASNFNSTIYQLCHPKQVIYPLSLSFPSFYVLRGR